jgi:ABC-2 type transport system permease protein
MSVFGTAGAASVDGITLPQMITYALIAGPMAFWDYQRLFYEIDAAVKSGDVAVYLLKPLHYPAVLFASTVGHIGFGLLAGVIPIILIVSFTLGIVPPASPLYAFAFLAFWVLGMVMLFMMACLLGLVAFWMMTAQSLEWFFSSIMTLFAGGIVPLWFMPGWFAAIAGHLPFAWVAFYPAAVYLGQLDMQQVAIYFAIGLVWLGILAAAVAYLWHRVRHRLIVQGG